MVPDRPNVLRPSWETEAPAPFDFKALRVAHHAGSQELGATLYEVAPGGAVSPLHTHLAHEELVIALTGQVSFRTPDGERVLEPGRSWHVSAAEKALTSSSTAARSLLACS